MERPSAVDLGAIFTSVHVPDGGQISVYQSRQSVFEHDIGPFDVTIVSPTATWTTVDFVGAMEPQTVVKALAARLLDEPVVVEGAQRGEDGIFVECRFVYSDALEDRIYEAIEDLERELGLPGNLHLSATYEHDDGS